MTDSIKLDRSCKPGSSEDTRLVEWSEPGRAEHDLVECKNLSLETADSELSYLLAILGDVLDQNKRWLFKVIELYRYLIQAI